MDEFKKSLFLFRRDIRLEDNTGLINASNSSLEVIPCFILDPRLLKNNRTSEYRMNFLKESLLELDQQLKKKKSHLHIFYGIPEKIINSIIKKTNVDAVFCNKDYTPFSRKRDKKILDECSKNNVNVTFSHDILLQDANTVKTNTGSPYKVFTAFFSKAKEIPVRRPQSHQLSNLSNVQTSEEIPIEKLDKYFGKIAIGHLKGGRMEGLRLLKNIKNLKNYESERNFPALNKTSKMSAHNKFGTCSPRETYYRIVEDLGSNHTLVSEMYWRDFFTHIMYHFPNSKNEEFNEKFREIPWSKNKKAFSKWCEGITGFPIIDAGMRELNHTGFMHNRVRMIVASFLTKDLHIDWKWGEEYFASKLLDYDASVNVGNWQWAASTGCDAQPWFRIFNPWIQQQKFDPDCTYIKNWIPELKEVPIKVIHKWDTKFLDSTKYPKPMVEHKEESVATKEIFKKKSKIGNSSYSK